MIGRLPGQLTDWELAFLALYAEDAFCASKARKPGDLRRVRVDPRLTPGWKVLGSLTANDALFRVGGHLVGAKEVFYGWFLKHKVTEQHVLAIRGTEGCLEWLVDGLFAPCAVHPVAGKVESGFWSVFRSMKLNGKPLSSIVDIAVGAQVTVVGHSLGAAVATYAALDLAQAGARVRGVFVASPHPGNAEFCKAFGEAVPDHVMYRNVKDIVPKVPWWFGYSDVPNVKMLSAKKSGIKITGGYSGQHHVLSYAALMDRDSLKSFRARPIDKPFLACVHL